MNYKYSKRNKQMISITKIIRYCFVMLILFIGNVLMWYTESPLIHIVVFWTISIILILISKLNLLNPLMWFTGFFMIYSTAYAILYVMFPQVSNYGYSPDNLRLQFFALTIFLLFVDTSNKNYKQLRFKYDQLRGKNSESGLSRSIEREQGILKLIIYFIIIVTLISTLIFISRGYSHKSQMWENRDIFYRISTHGLRYLVFFISMLLLRSNESIKKYRIIIIMGLVVTLIFTLYSAERDTLLRFILMFILTIYAKHLLKTKSILLMVPIGVLGMILLNSIKYYFINGTISNNSIISVKQLIYLFLNTDFHAPGSNLQVLLSSNFNEKFGFIQIVKDIIGSILPSELFLNPSVWFNTTFFYNSTWSRAFSLVGEGYIIGGYLGVAAVFGIIGMLNRIIVKLSERSYIGIALYIYFIITTISSFRSTLGAIFIGMVKVPFLSIVMLWIINNIFIKSKNNLKLLNKIK